MWVWEPIAFKPTPLHLGVHKVEGKHRAGSSELWRTRARESRDADRSARSADGRAGPPAPEPEAAAPRALQHPPGGRRRALPGRPPETSPARAADPPPRDSCLSGVFSSGTCRGLSLLFLGVHPRQQEGIRGKGRQIRISQNDSWPYHGCLFPAAELDGVPYFSM